MSYPPVLDFGRDFMASDWRDPGRFNGLQIAHVPLDQGRHLPVK
jgi:hypothetical protein